MTERILLNTLRKFQFENHEVIKDKSNVKTQAKVGWMYKTKAVNPASLNLWKYDNLCVYI